MIIRRVKPQDRDAMTAILNEVIAIGGTTAYQKPIGPSHFDRFITPEDDQTFLHVAEADGEVVGFQWMSPDKEGMGIIATFARPGTVQRGIGSALFQQTLKCCRDAGYTLLDATIRADNTGGLAYYSKMGFEDHSVTRAVPLADGTPVDRVHKRMHLR
ncbi:L-amino acid N-acyltransferase YncA [Litoreibacter meonggei]|uniref:L-amino acid N-acyltransferase YncA n=1 Tax=Litoreibacter meonggei TaxID=1049199 RepID=A0A497VQG8_9RHOB|nr:GNAT family N-acetyltransferase [Litoreibacter meonggei]RLJ41276.1 L-amino acid N-acyltransferase YncA [Litoreibacter meonggei]